MLGEVEDEILERLLAHQGKWVEEKKFKVREANVVPSILVIVTPDALIDKHHSLSGLARSGIISP